MIFLKQFLPQDNELLMHKTNFLQSLHNKERLIVKYHKT